MHYRDEAMAVVRGQVDSHTEKVRLLNVEKGKLTDQINRIDNQIAAFTKRISDLNTTLEDMHAFFSKSSV